MTIMYKIFAYIVYIYLQKKERVFFIFEVFFIVNLHNLKHLHHLRNLENSDVQFNQIIMKIPS